MRPMFVLRWAARDLRRKWLQVAAIALIIGIGTGVYAGLGNTKQWRYDSNDASFELLAMYDLRVRAAEGADAPTGAMLDVLTSLPDAGVVTVAEERLVLPTQVDASIGAETILVPGRIIGVDVAGGGPHVNGLYVDDDEGRTLSATDAGEPVAVLERNFARFYDLAPEGDVRVAGGSEVHYVGHGMSPEYFFVTTEQGGFFAEADFAALFVPLDTAQSLTGHTDRVNDLVLRLRPGADPVAVGADVEAAFESRAADLGVTVMQTEDADAYQILYDDIEGDQQFWNVFAALIFAGAAFGAFNLASRMVEAQRREIGIGMALGSSPRELAVRPLLVGAQIALLGAVLGVVMGLILMAAVVPVYKSMLPLPVWQTSVQPGLFLRGAALGFLVPLVATAWPVWRAVRVMPVDAIAVTHRSARGGLAPLLRRMPWPVSAFRRMPIGNVLRAPRRTLLTALGIGAAIATLVATLGMLDSFFAAMDRNEDEQLQDHPDRVVVALDGFVAVDGPEVASVAAADGVAAVEPVVRVGVRLSADGAEGFDALLEVIDFDNELWAPTFQRGAFATDGGGLLIGRKAADDLGVGPGDEVTVRHPVLAGAGVRIEETAMTVAGIHRGPFRFNVYLDSSQLAAAGTEGLTNELYVLPGPGSTPDDLERQLFDLDGVASVQPVSTSTRVVRDSLGDFVAIFRVLEAFILLLALLIAYNATSINADERAKERATLFAFGLPLRRVIRLETVEGMITGLLGTAIGVVVGLGIARWVNETVFETTVPDIGMDVVISASTLLSAIAFGVIAVGVAPLLTVRRLRRMDIPGTLRTVE